jgi:hypothetical protein
MSKLDARSGKRERREYSAPTLSVYGSVRELTGGSTGTASDGNNATNPNKPTGGPA